MQKNGDRSFISKLNFGQLGFVFKQYESCNIKQSSNYINVPILKSNYPAFNSLICKIIESIRLQYVKQNVCNDNFLKICYMHNYIYRFKSCTIVHISV